MKTRKKLQKIKTSIEFLDSEIQILESEILNYDVTSSTGEELFNQLQKKLLQREKLNEKSNSDS